MWVRSRYTSELAVLAAWVSVLVPWNIVYHSSATVEEAPVVEGTIFFLRFAFFEMQIRQQTVTDPIPVDNFDEFVDVQYAGSQLFGGFYLTTPPSSMSFYDGTLLLASAFWTLGAVALALALVLSLALYLRTDETVARLPVSEVRLMGGLLGVAAAAVAGSSVLYFLERDTMGIPIPAGVLVVGAFAVVLLVIEEVPEETA